MAFTKRPAITALLALLLAACSSAPLSSSTASSRPSSRPSSSSTPSPSDGIASHRPPLGGPIVFDRAGGTRLGIVEADGSRARELLPGFPGELLSVDWSTDGSKLVFYQLIPHAEAGIYETDATGSAPRRLELGCQHRPGLAGCDEDDWPSYSPDGRRLAVVRWKGIWDPTNEPPPTSTVVVVVDLATGEPKELSSTELPFSSDAGIHENLKPRWSPDGTRLVFHRVHFDDSGPVGSELWVVDSDDSNLQRITPTDLTAGDADWSPDGSLIVFSSKPLWSWFDSLDAVGLIHGQDLYTIRPDGTGLSRLTDDMHSATPRWTPDGSAILFTRLGANSDGTENRTDFWLMGRDGSDPYAVTNLNGCCAWYGDMQPLPPR